LWQASEKAYSHFILTSIGTAVLETDGGSIKASVSKRRAAPSDNK